MLTQKYFSDNLITRFIKCLLWDTYLPISNIWCKNKPLIKGLTYITYDKNIAIAKKDYIPGIDPEPISSMDSNYFKYVRPYVTNEFYPAVTSNFQSNSFLYDSDTHYYLGQYLRMQRDLYGLNLMPYYNCFSGITSDKFRIDSGKLETNNSKDDDYITFITNIDFNQQYTIYYNCNSPIYLLPVYYDGIVCKQFKDIGNSDINTIKVNSCSFTQPYVYKGLNYQGNAYEGDINIKLVNKYVKLLIQVPKNNSSLVVLEGNYSKCKLNLNDNEQNQKQMLNINKVIRNYFGDVNEKENDKLILDDYSLNNILVSYPGLIRNLSNISYAFSDRLIEYLLYAPIVKNDRIKSNILRIQKNLTTDKAEKLFGSKYENIYLKDIWDNNLRVAIYNDVCQNSKIALFEDINGFVDKDSEFLIDKASERDQEVDKLNKNINDLKYKDEDIF